MRVTTLIPSPVATLAVAVLPAGAGQTSVPSRGRWGFDASRTLAVGVFIAAACVGLSACSSGERTEPHKRVVLITLDTLRHDSFAGAAHGNAQGTQMPFTRRWAEKGRVFERCYAATSTTQPTHATIFTGLHPWQHGVLRNGVALADSHDTVAEKLRRAGYRTAAVVASFPVHRQFNFDQGFDTFLDDFTKGDQASWNQVVVEGGRFYSGADTIVEKAKKVVDELGGERQFFWFHFFDAHAPYGDSVAETTLNPTRILRSIESGTASVQEILRLARSRYDLDIRHMDTALERLLQRLDDGVETHIVVVSDHGESFGEDGSLGHGKRLTPEQIHVPCFLLSPRVEPGVIRQPVGSIDIAATLLSLADLGERPEGTRDLSRPTVAPGRVFGMRRTYAQPYTEVRIDRTEHVITPADHKFFLVEGDAVFTGNGRKVWLGDGDVPVADVAKADALRALFATWESALEGVRFEEVVDPETLRKLRELGYAQ